MAFVEPAVPEEPVAPAFTYASRGALKMEAALRHFGLDVSDRVCADLGCSNGGFTDVLLRRGAARVHAVDTAYGQLDYRLRSDPRVAVHERSNALHLDPPELCGVVVIDIGWTKQALAVPAALRWLSDDAAARVVSLVKPHYESGRHSLTVDEADAVTVGVLDAMPALGVAVEGCIRCPIRGGKGKNIEHLALLRASGVATDVTDGADGGRSR